jgi:hypothetical protein
MPVLVPSEQPPPSNGVISLRRFTPADVPAVTFAALDPGLPAPSGDRRG